MFNLPKNQSGQALLLVLLSMAVALTLVLSVLSRTISDVKISSQDENSLRAFSAAEAGVEQALVVGSDTGSVDIGDAKFSAKVSDFAEGENAFVFSNSFVSGEPAIVWFVSHDPITGNLSCSGAGNPCFKGDRIKICWGDNPVTPVPAIEASIIYLNTAGNYSTVKIARATFDDNASRRSSNNFENPGGSSCTIGSNTFQYGKTLVFNSFSPSIPYDQTNKLQFMILKLLYNNTAHSIGVDVAGSGSVLPSQGQLVESSGTSGDANRSINVFQGYGELPSAFYYAIYGDGGLIK